MDTDLRERVFAVFYGTSGQYENFGRLLLVVDVCWPICTWGCSRCAVSLHEMMPNLIADFADTKVRAAFYSGVIRMAREDSGMTWTTPGIC
jgi:hypothetical protein